MAVMSATRRGKHQLLGQIGSPVQVKYGAEGKIKKQMKIQIQRVVKVTQGDWQPPEQSMELRRQETETNTQGQRQIQNEI